VRWLLWCVSVDGNRLGKKREPHEYIYNDAK
jgi:hypothetical protein